MKTKGRLHYCVLFTQAAKEEKLRLILEKEFPKDRGIVLLPAMEWWKRGGNKKEVRPLFPGYVFIHSDMSVREIHEFVRAHQAYLGAFVKELGLSERKASGAGFYGEREDGYAADLTEEETRFLDLMLNEKGIVEMSEGYREKGKYIVEKGPLKAFEKQIVDVDMHNRMAYLDFQFKGRVTKAGMEIRPKRYWFPDDKDAPVLLDDGTEVNLQELRKRMTEA